MGRVFIRAASGQQLRGRLLAHFFPLAEGAVGGEHVDTFVGGSVVADGFENPDCSDACCVQPWHVLVLQEAVYQSFLPSRFKVIHLELEVSRAASRRASGQGGASSPVTPKYGNQQAAKLCHWVGKVDYEMKLFRQS
jgi:hypothetical protein